MMRISRPAWIAYELETPGVSFAMLFQLFQTLDVVLDVLAACARTGGGDRVGRLNQAGNNGLCLDVAVMRLDGVNDRRGFLVLLGKVYADLDMAALDLVVDRLADVMQQACAARLNRVETQLARHHAGDVRDLDGVLQDVLAVAGAVAQAAEQILTSSGWMPWMPVSKVARSPSLLMICCRPRGLAFSTISSMRAGWMRPSTISFSSAIRAISRRTGSNDGQGDRLRRVVDDEVYAGQRLERADIAALAADDAALHLIIGQRNDRDGRLGNVVCRAALDGSGDDLAGGLLALILEPLVDLADLDGSVMLRLGLDRVDEHFACFVARHARDLFELFYLFVLDALELVLLSSVRIPDDGSALRSCGRGCRSSCRALPRAE